MSSQHSRSGTRRLSRFRHSLYGNYMDEVRHQAPATKGTTTAANTALTSVAPSIEEVVRDYAPRIYNLARRMLGNDADAEDVTQEVLLQLVRKLDTFRGQSAFPTWLHRVTVNAALEFRRKRATREDGRTQDPLDDFAAEGHHHG